MAEIKKMCLFELNQIKQTKENPFKKEGKKKLRPKYIFDFLSLVTTTKLMKCKLRNGSQNAKWISRHIGFSTKVVQSHSAVN